MAYLLAIHVLSAVVWVGGMFFALLVLRPAVGPMEPAVRLALWRRVFARFFPAVSIAVLALLATGHAMILVELGGFSEIGMSEHLMQGIGVLMAAIYLVLLVGPYRAFLKALDAGVLPAAGRAIERIRWLITINLALGVVTIVIATTGHYWG
ncbi:MAG: CopD family protein [Rhodospirillales bacterium]|nr:CopD family protein [Rhodospirillales bacterium]MDE0381490.1 CopD family protein [Rhodospirillales bacterium]